MTGRRASGGQFSCEGWGLFRGHRWGRSHGHGDWVQLFDEAGVTRLTIKDDGIGFDPLEERAGHYGIAIIRERASAVGAELYIDSFPSRGSTINLLLQSSRKSEKQTT